MNLEKTLKNFGRGVLGTILAGTLMFCQNGTTSTKDIDDEEETPVVQTGDIQGYAVAPKVKDNKVVWEGLNGTSILIDNLEKAKSISDGLFYVSGVSAGVHDLQARYQKLYQSEKMGVPVKAGMLTTINVNIKMTPTSEDGEIVHGIIYADDTKTSRYNGRLRLIKYLQTKSDIIDGVYAFQGFVDGQEMMADIIPGVEAKRIKFFDKQNPSNEFWQIDLGTDWIKEQNGYVVE